MGTHGVGRRTAANIQGIKRKHDAGGVTALGELPSAQLPGYLPKVQALDVERLRKKHGDVPAVRTATLVAEVHFGMPSSGLTQLKSGEMLAVNDNSGVYEIVADGKPRELFALKDAEGITVDNKGEYLYVLEEGKCRVRKLKVSHDDDGKLKLKDTDDSRALQRPKSDRNTGWEGISFLSREQAGTKADCLVCVHEASPRRIGIYQLPDLDDGVTLKLPAAAKELLPDLADIAVDPDTGHFFVVSDQSRTVVELALVREARAATQGLIDNMQLVAVASFPLPLSGNQKPEGLFFDARGRLWVSLDYENDDVHHGKALVLELNRE